MKKKMTNWNIYSPIETYAAIKMFYAFYDTANANI